MNTIPPGAIPKLFRQKVNGNEVGSYYVNVRKKPVNLRTKDYMKARDRARAAYYEGVTTFEDDRYVGELRQLPPIPHTNGATKTHEKSVDDWTVDFTQAASNGAPPPLQPEVVPKDEPRPDIPPISQDHSTEAPPEPPKIDPPAGGTRVSPDMLRGIIHQAAQIVCRLQIMGQEWLWAKWGGVKVKEIPPDHESLDVPVKLWEQAISEWIPPDLPVPAWLLAPILCAACTIPVQMSEMTPIPKTAKPSTPTTE